jgi:hypothetical protein
MPRISLYQKFIDSEFHQLMNVLERIANALETMAKIQRNDDEIQYTKCSICSKEIDARDGHLHQGSLIGECCWDERLRSSE